MKDLQRRRAIHALGQRAIDYYVDCGLCVFCAADDVHGMAHDDHCNVGELAGIEVTAPRISELAEARRIVGAIVDHGLVLDAIRRCPV